MSYNPRIDFNYDYVLEQFKVYSKIKAKVQRFPIIP